MASQDDLLNRLNQLSPELIAAEAKNRELYAALQAEKRRTESLVTAVYQAARDAAQFREHPTPAKPKRDRRTVKPEVALVHATDWQCGKKTVSYDTEVLRARMQQFAEKINTITSIQRADHPVRDCVLALGGDMVEGVTIFPGQSWAVDTSLYEQLFNATDIAEQLVLDLLDTFERVDLVAEYGNHGRLGGKRDGVPAGDNIDRIMYGILAERLARNPATAKRTSMQASDEFYQVVTIGSYKALLIHGDEIKHFGGNTPAYGIKKKNDAWKAGALEADSDFRDVYVGHFHQPLVLPLANGSGRIFVTPSPESGNAYAKEFVAATGRPAQRLHFVDPAEGQVTAEYVVWL
jgi:hypothetical protein